MKFHQPKIQSKFLILSCVLIFSAILVLSVGKEKRKTACYQNQLAAAQQMKRCIDSLSASFDYLIENELDPNRTCLIGPEYSPITTTLGSLMAKRTSTNPDFTALIVRWFCELNLKPNDVVAIGYSGSFPALWLATLCAAEAMDLNPVMIPSLGASSYGANRPELTIIDIENFLFERKLINHRSRAASLGGAHDLANDLSEEGRGALLDAIKRQNVLLIEEKDLTKNVKLREQYYMESGKPKVFVNIGGAQINVGSYVDEKRLSPGLNFPHFKLKNEANLMTAFFAGQGIPIIHLLHIERIALEYGLPIDPVPLPEPGICDVYFDEKNSLVSLIISCLFIVGAIFVPIFGKKKK